MLEKMSIIIKMNIKFVTMNVKNLIYFLLLFMHIYNILHLIGPFLETMISVKDILMRNNLVHLVFMLIAQMNIFLNATMIFNENNIVYFYS